MLQVACKKSEQTPFRAKEDLTFLAVARFLILQFELVSTEIAYASLYHIGGIFLGRGKQRTRVRTQYGQSKGRVGQSERPGGPSSDAGPGGNVSCSSERNTSQIDRGAKVLAAGVK